MKIHIRNARLNKRISTLNINLEDLVHMLPKIKSNGPRYSRRSTAVADIPPDRERPEGNLEFVAKFHDGLDFSNIAGEYFV